MPTRTNIDEFFKQLDADFSRIEDGIFKSMQYAGEKFVKDARLMSKAQGGFGDDTGNLRSSIGYFIIKNGSVIDQMIYLADKGTDRVTGMNKTLSEVQQIPASTGFKLIGLAGMDYASHVEAQGLNVISIQGDQMVIDLEKYLKAIR